MFFQKLENMLSQNNYSHYWTVLSLLDRYLAYLPQTYYDKIDLDSFAISNALSYTILDEIANHLVEMNFLHRVFFVQCECGSYFYKTDNLENLSNYLASLDDIEIRECCGMDSELANYEVHIRYSLHYYPNFKETSTANESLEELSVKNGRSRTLIDYLDAHPEVDLELPELRSQLTNGLKR